MIDRYDSDELAVRREFEAIVGRVDERVWAVMWGSEYDREVPDPVHDLVDRYRELQRRFALPDRGNARFVDRGKRPSREPTVRRAEAVSSVLAAIAVRTDAGNDRATRTVAEL